MQIFQAQAGKIKHWQIRARDFKSCLRGAVPIHVLNITDMEGHLQSLSVSEKKLAIWDFA